MLELSKTKNSHGYDCYEIITNEGSIYISFENNMDLYWTYVCQGNILKHSDSKELYITKENYEIYNFFDALYNSVVHYSVYEENKNFFSSEYIPWAVNENNPEALVSNGIITWHSDDYVYEKASKFSVEKMDDEYKITFTKSKMDNDDGLFVTFSVRISNSGSRYNPFNILFMKMYLNLKNYDPNYRQIHMEEVLYLSKKGGLL